MIHKTAHIALLLPLVSFLWACNGELKERNAELKIQADTLAAEVRFLRSEQARLLEELGKPLPVGFEVQIGAFAHFDIQAYGEEMARFHEIETDGLHKYVLARFSTFADAEAFLADVKQMGLEDAFIAGVVNGQRTTVAEAQAAAKAYYGDF